VTAKPKSICDRVSTIVSYQLTVDPKKYVILVAKRSE
jgi:hypothetical protein